MAKKNYISPYLLLDSTIAVNWRNNFHKIMTAWLLFLVIVSSFTAALIPSAGGSNILFILPMLAIGGGSGAFIAYKLEKGCEKEAEKAISLASTSISAFVSKKYSIRLLEPVKFNVNPNFGNPADYITVSQEPLQAIDGKTGRPIKVILELTPSLLNVNLSVITPLVTKKRFWH